MPGTPVHRAWRPSKALLLAMLAVGLAGVYAEHRMHVIGVLPYLLLVACPLMHLVHHGHRGHGHVAGGGDPAPGPSGPRGDSYQGRRR